MSRRSALTVLLLALVLRTDRLAGLEATVFLSQASPGETWKHGFGGALTSTWFHLLDLEGEASKQPLEFDQGSLVAFTGSALLAPSFGRLSPYGGLGVGFFRQTLGATSDTGTLHCLVLGLKLKLGLLVLKGDYRGYSLSGAPLALLDKRFTLGGGVSF